MPRDESILYTFTYKFRFWFRVAREAGVDIDRFLADKGVTEEQLLEPNRRMLRQHVVEWAYELIELIGDPELGLRLAESCKLTDADLLGYLLRNCPHPLAAMQELSKYSRLISDVLQFEVEIDLDKVAVVMGSTGARKIDPFEIDVVMGCHLSHDTTVLGGKDQPFRSPLGSTPSPSPESLSEFF